MTMSNEGLFEAYYLLGLLKERLRYSKDAQILANKIKKALDGYVKELSAPESVPDTVTVPVIASGASEIKGGLIPPYEVTCKEE